MKNPKANTDFSLVTLKYW